MARPRDEGTTRDPQTKETRNPADDFSRHQKSERSKSGPAEPSEDDE